MAESDAPEHRWLGIGSKVKIVGGDEDGESGVTIGHDPGSERVQPL